MAYILVPLAILIAFIWALVVFPSFRVVTLILVALGVIVYYSAREKPASEQKREKTAQEQKQEEALRMTFEAERSAFCQAEQKRWAIVSASQIELRGASLKQVPLYGTINEDYDITASVKNKSKSKVTALRLNVTALDCPIVPNAPLSIVPGAEGEASHTPGGGSRPSAARPTEGARAADCDIIGSGDKTFDTDIPVGETRQIKGKITLRDVAEPRGVFTARFVVNGVRAPVDQSDNLAVNDARLTWVYNCNQSESSAR